MTFVVEAHHETGLNIDVITLLVTLLATGTKGKHIITHKHAMYYGICNELPYNRVNYSLA